MPKSPVFLLPVGEIDEDGSFAALEIRMQTVKNKSLEMEEREMNGTDIDDAVVEVEAEEVGGDGGIRLGGARDDGPDDVFGARAGVSVEAHLDLSMAGGERA